MPRARLGWWAIGTDSPQTERLRRKEKEEGDAEQSGSEAWWAGPEGLGRKLWVADPARKGPGSLAPRAP